MCEQANHEIQGANRHEKMLALIVTEETLIQMRANLSLLHLAKRRKKKNMCEVGKGLGATPLRLAGGGTDPNLSGQSLVKCMKSFMLCIHLRI